MLSDSSPVKLSMGFVNFSMLKSAHFETSSCTFILTRLLDPACQHGEVNVQ